MTDRFAVDCGPIDDFVDVLAQSLDAIIFIIFYFSFTRRPNSIPFLARTKTVPE